MTSIEAESWKETKQWRRDERRHLLRARIDAGGRQRRAWGEAIETRLRQLLAEPAGLTIAFYWPFKGEFDARALIGELSQNGARAALPVVVTPRAPMEFWRWRPGDPTVRGAYKIPVPAERDPVTPDVLLVPLLGFDADAYRLGYGTGYYDRTLAVLSPRPVAIGIGYEQGRLATICPQPHDIAMDFVVTEDVAWQRLPACRSGAQRYNRG